MSLFDQVKLLSKKILEKADRDKSMPGFQIVPGGVKAGVKRVTTDPGQYSFTRGFSNIQPATKTVLTPFLGQQRASNVGYGLRGASQLTPFQLPNITGLDKRGQQFYRSSAPVTPQQKQAQSIGRSVYGYALTAPIGGGNLLKNVATRATISSGIGSALGAGLNKAMGGSALEGAKQGALQGFKAGPLLSITNPLTSKAIGMVGGGLIANQLGTRTVGGLANVIEDEILSKADGITINNKDRVLSLVIGAVLSGNSQLIKSSKIKLKSLGIKNADDIVKRAKSRLPEDAIGIKFMNKNGNEFNRIMSKSDAKAWTAYLDSQGIKYEVTKMGNQGGFAQLGSTPKPPKTTNKIKIKPGETIGDYQVRVQKAQGLPLLAEYDQALQAKNTIKAESIAKQIVADKKYADYKPVFEKRTGKDLLSEARKYKSAEELFNKYKENIFNLKYYFISMKITSFIVG
jgi:hypothetical protein